MNIQQIQQIVNSSLPDNAKRLCIITVIANDEQAIPDILEMLNNERETNKELILESNAELSRALITLQDPNLGKKNPKPYIELSFVIGEIKKHYLKWQNKIKCTFKVDGLP